MKTFAAVALSCLSLLACSGSDSASNQAQVTRVSQEGTSPHRVRGEGVGVKVSALVEKVDLEKRQITLKIAEGNSTVYQVSKDVKRLAEVKAGDKLSADYQVAMQAELREPTAIEKATPLAILDIEAKGVPSQAPKGNLGRVLRVVTTIEALDAKTQSLTVKGPLGGTLTAPVENPAVFKELQVGKTIVVIFAESLTLEVTPR
jgi:hypothetical protein